MTISRSEATMPAQLNDHQLAVMRSTYPGFKEKDAVVRRVKASQRQYHATPGYVPLVDGDPVDMDKMVHPWSD